MPDTSPSSERVAARLAEIHARPVWITHDVPALLVALKDVLALHKPEARGRVMNCCRGCEEENGEFHEDCCHEWPCPTYRAISAALLGEDGHG
jgi:hypothetical protein